MVKVATIPATAPVTTRPIVLPKVPPLTAVSVTVPVTLAAVTIDLVSAFIAAANRSPIAVAVRLFVTAILYS